MAKSKTTKPQNYRLRITKAQQGHRSYTTYVVRKSDRVIYMSGDETPLALSNLIHDDAAGTRFVLEDALDGAAAAKALRDVLAKQWANNPPLMPIVEVLP